MTLPERNERVCAAHGRLPLRGTDIFKLCQSSLPYEEAVLLSSYLNKRELPVHFPAYIDSDSGIKRATRISIEGNGHNGNRNFFHYP